MDDTLKMGKFKENPDLFRLHLQDAFKECIETISYKHLKAYIGDTRNDFRELQIHVQEALTNSINERINYSFEYHNIASKVKEIAELEKKASDNIAWRPTTGVVDNKMAKAYALRNRQNLLLMKIKQADAQADLLRQDIIAKRNNLEQHMDDLRAHTEALGNN